MSALKETITAHPFFKGMKPAHFATLTAGAREAKFNAGEILFHEGEPAANFYLIQKGRIALEAHEPADGTVTVQELKDGDVVGWSWLYPPFVWHLQARALEPAEVIVLDGAHLLVAAERHHDFGYELMKRVSQIVIRRLQATRKQWVAEMSGKFTHESTVPAGRL